MDAEKCRLVITISLEDAPARVRTVARCEHERAWDRENLIDVIGTIAMGLDEIVARFDTGDITLMQSPNIDIDIVKAWEAAKASGKSIN